MLSVRASKSRVLSAALVVTFVILVTPLPTRAEDQSKSIMRQGTLQGIVYTEGMKSTQANAIVKIRNLNNQKEYASPPTDPKGAYKILLIEEGWYTLGVTTPMGDFNLNYGVYIKAGETAKLSVEMLPGGVLEGKGGGNGGGKAFFATPAGILIIVAMAAGVGLGVYELAKNEPEASPIR